MACPLLFSNHGNTLRCLYYSSWNFPQGTSTWDSASKFHGFLLPSKQRHRSDVVLTQGHSSKKVPFRSFQIFHCLVLQQNPKFTSLLSCREVNLALYDFDLRIELELLSLVISDCRWLWFRSLPLYSMSLCLDRVAMYDLGLISESCPNTVNLLRVSERLRHSTSSTASLHKDKLLMLICKYLPTV